MMGVGSAFAKHRGRVEEGTLQQKDMGLGFSKLPYSYISIINLIPPIFKETCEVLFISPW